MYSLRTMGQPMPEIFTVKVRLSKKQEKRANIAALVFMIVMAFLAVLITHIV